MSMLDDIGQNTEEKAYAFAGSEPIDDYMSQFNRPKQDMGIDEADGLDDFEEPSEEEEQEPFERIDTQMKSGAAKAAGKLVTTVIDTTIPQALAFIAKGSADEYKASEEDREELEDALTQYMRLKGGEIPPSMMTLILVLTIYGTKLPQAIQQRKLNEREEQLALREKELLRREQELLHAKSINTPIPVQENAQP